MENLYLFYGENRRKIEDKVNELIGRSEADEYNVSYFDMEESSFKDALRDALSIPFLSDFRLVVLKNCYFFQDSLQKGAIDKDFKDLEEYFKNPQKTSIMVLEAPYDSIDKKSKLFSIISLNGKAFECRPYVKDDIVKYIEKTLKDKHHEIEPGAFHELIGRLSEDPLNFENEMEKLVLYLQEGEKITFDIIDMIISKDITDNAFSLLNAITEKNRKKSLLIYYDLLKSGNTPISLLALIERKFQEILYTKELLKTNSAQDDVAGYFKISKGRAYYLMKNAREISDVSVKKALFNCRDLDYKIKTGQLEQEAGLELFLLKV